MELRPPTPADRARLLELNRDSVQHLSPLDEQRLEQLLSIAHRCLVAVEDEQVLAFAMAMAPGSGYDSDNYRWFEERLQSFLYLDRIAVEAHARRRGIGAALYDAIEDAARPFGRMVCEVNVVPANEPSLAFHAARGYREIGRLQHAEREVAMFSKELDEPAPD